MKSSSKTEMIKETTVTREMLADAVGSGSLRVYATPMAAALCENAAAALAQEYVDDGCTTVGTMLCVEHTSPTPVGGHVRAKPVLTGIDGRKFSFSLTVCDDAGEIMRGTHERVSVKSESFQKKANEKFIQK